MRHLTDADIRRGIYQFLYEVLEAAEFEELGIEVMSDEDASRVLELQDEIATVLGQKAGVVEVVK